jgi:hypothetical protein
MSGWRAAIGGIVLTAVFYSQIPTPLPSRFVTARWLG